MSRAGASTASQLVAYALSGKQHESTWIRPCCEETADVSLMDSLGARVCYIVAYAGGIRAGIDDVALMTGLSRPFEDCILHIDRSVARKDNIRSVRNAN